MTERTDTLTDTGVLDDSFAHICRMLNERRSTKTERQSIERGDFAFNYEGEEEYEGFELLRCRTPGHKSKYTTVRVPFCNNYAPARSGFIDWVNFTFCHGQEDQQLAILLLSGLLENMLGYSITAKRSKGLNLYEESYILGDNWGFVCIGGQNNTVMVTINGEGCVAARKGWEKRLYDVAEMLSSYQFRLTRVDVAHDLFKGEYTVDNAVKDYDDGLFGTGGRIPKIQQYGNWRIPDDTSGRTVYLGSRKSGKYCRVYEKGKQLGQDNSPWVRIECEWRSKNRDIPYDILIKPGCYLAGAYPAFLWINKVQSRIKTKVKKEKITYDKYVKTLKHQYGDLILCMTKVEGSYENVIKKIIGHKIPKRLLSPDWKNPNKLICTT
jgi:phage replication initiation protein